MKNDFYYKFLTPPDELADFVESIGMFHNDSDEVKEVVIVPDGRVDLFFIRSGDEPFQAMLVGLETGPDQRSIQPHTLAYTISFKPIAVEYVLHTTIADIVNMAKVLPDDFWGFIPDALESFDVFYTKATEKIQSLLPEDIDNRKLELFRLIYSSNGEMTVHELSEKVYWSSRQINRYFNHQAGISLKAFCTILRFRKSLEHIAEGRTFPGAELYRQAHFIKEIKKYAGVVPKDLAKNANDRFILLSVLRQQ